jgi:hypothetical protein
MSRWYDNHTPDDETTITHGEWKRAQTSGSSPNPPAAATPERPADHPQPRGGDGPDLDDLRRILNDVHHQVVTAARETEWRTLNTLHRLEQALADRELCDVCAGTGWAPIPDPFLDGATTDQACPACRDTTIRGAE